MKIQEKVHQTVLNCIAVLVTLLCQATRVVTLLLSYSFKQLVSYTEAINENEHYIIKYYLTGVTPPV